jgi:undecaprenyl-diphosphatase
VLMAAIWVFAMLADEMMEGGTHGFDEWLLLALRNPLDRSDPLGPGWIEELGRDFTALGGVGVLTMLTLIVVGYLALLRKYSAALLVLASVGGGLLLSTLLKFGFDRPRPDLVPHGSIVYTASFPSGHSMMSAVTYLTLGALLARIQKKARVKAYLLLCSILLTVLVGLSRVYLGVHWPTDVLAGWTAGAAWALICWLIARWLQQRGHIEEDLEDAPLPGEEST